MKERKKQREETSLETKFARDGYFWGLKSKSF